MNEEQQTTEPSVDIFNWANQLDARKNDVQVELFVFNKNYTPFYMRVSGELEAQLKPLFLLDYINFVNLGAGTGLSVHDYETAETEDNTLLRTDQSNVGRADTLIHLIEKERHDIQDFSEFEHEFKRLKGMLARFTFPGQSGKTFYSVKAIQQSSAIKGALSWELSDDTMRPFQADVGFKVPADNQVLIVDGSIFIFNRPKFERLFQYERRKELVANERVKQIEAAYKLSFADGLDLASLVREKKSVMNKLEKLEVGEVSQEQALAYADEVGIDLMTDDAGAIIILDGGDLSKFVNLINEDYIVSEITNRRYEITRKKLLDKPEGEPPRGIAG